MTYLAPDSSFTFKDVPLGMHLIQPFHISAYFPEVKRAADTAKLATRLHWTHTEGQRNEQLEHSLGHTHTPALH